MRRLVLIVILAVAPAIVQAGDVYKWTDAGGVVHYSDTEPAAEMKAELLHVTGNAAMSAATAAAAGARVDVDGNADPAGGDGAAKPSGTLAKSVVTAEGRCAKARSNLEVLQSNQPVGIASDGAGTPKPLDDAARSARIDNELSLIATYCR
jgi:hypothetical protein